jgi:hypothetical protein
LACLADGDFEGALASPSVHREPALFGDRSRPPRSFFRHRGTHARRHARRSRNGQASRVRVRRVCGPIGCRAGDPAVQLAAISGAEPGRQRSARARGSPTGSASARRRLRRSPSRRTRRRRRVWRPTAGRRRGLRRTSTRWSGWSTIRPWWRWPRSVGELRSPGAATAAAREKGATAGTQAARSDQGTHGWPHLRRG